MSEAVPHPRQDNLALERKRFSMAGILWALIVILIVFWLIGFVFAPVAGSLIHILLIVALVLIVWNLFSGRRAV